MANSYVKVRVMREDILHEINNPEQKYAISVLQFCHYKETT